VALEISMYKKNIFDFINWILSKIKASEKNMMPLMHIHA